MAEGKSSWQGKIALITGGSSGIGLAISRYLAKRGAHVWLLARDTQKLNSALESLNPAGNQLCGSISADVSDWDQVSSAVARVEDEIGLPDFVVNSAGVAHPGYFQDLDLEIFHWMMDVNYFGTLNLCKALVPGMIKRGSGWILNISSGAGFIGRYGYTAYGASKYAVRGFTDILRSELKPRGITVSLAFPPDVDTPQLAYEQQYQPAETKALSGVASLISPSWEDKTTLMSPEQVAEDIMRQVERGHYMILPGLEMKSLYWLQGFVGTGLYPILDWMIARAQHNIQKGD